MLRYETKDDASWVAVKAALVVKRTINENNRLARPTVLGLATGSTPLLFYKELIRMHNRENLDFSRVITFNLDEYVGLAPSHSQSYHHYMHVNFFNHVNIHKNNIHLLDGTLTDPEAIKNHLLDYEKKISEVGGIDIQILGIGGNGHIAFNEPGSDFTSKTRVVALDQKTRADNACFFSNHSEVPTHAMTMGIGTIMKARQCLLLATGKQKAEIVARTLKTAKATEVIPATALNNHPNTIFLLDSHAARLLNDRGNKAGLFARQQKTKQDESLGTSQNFIRARL